MNNSPYVFDVTAAEFSERVLERSQQVPVLVDFWADWCGPCRMLSPVLDNIAQSYDGKLFVAKVNTDIEQELATQYQVRSLPTVKLFYRGKIVDEFMGVQPESAIRELLEKYIPRESDAIRQAAQEASQAGRNEEALVLLRRAHSEDPDNYRVDLDLADILIHQNQPAEAEKVLRNLPAKYAEEPEVKRLLATSHLANKINDAPDLDTLKNQIQSDPEDLNSRELLAARYILNGEYEAGMDEYLEIMRRNQQYNDGAGRRGLIAAFELIDDDERSSPYRRKMFNLMH